MLEIGNALSKKRYRQAATALLNALENDPDVSIVSLSDDLYFQAVALFADRPDKPWSLVDCVPFIVMQDRGILEVLTTDEHFEQAGFLTLLH